jgi:hypothetical protein
VGSGGTVPVGAGQMVFKPFQNSLNRIKQTSNRSNFNWSKKDIPKLRKIEIKYSFENLEEMNNFLHRNFLKIRMDLELKFRKISRLEFNIVSS